MASWFTLSLPNIFYNEDDNDDDDEDDKVHSELNPASPSEISSVIGRQLRGVADFLAPPPSTSDAASDSEDTSIDTIIGIKNDLIEIGGSFKSKLSLLTDISRFASNILQFRDCEDEKVVGEGLGITEEVVNFVQHISKRPELWTDFPLLLRNDFDMSDIQREHAAAIEDMVPSIAALRHEICSYVNEEFFWMIYFILLLPRLNENDSKLLSTPEIVEARDILLQKLQKRNMAPLGNSEVFESVKTSKNSSENDHCTQANMSSSHGNKDLDNKIDLKINYCVNTKKFEEKDILFSDLEIDDNYLSGKPGFRQSENSSCSESNDWVELNGNLVTLGDKQKAVPSTSRNKGSESEESNEWLTIDDSDLDHPAVS